MEGNELRKQKVTEKEKKKEREGDRGPYLGSLTSGAPDLEGKNRKKGRKGKKEGHKKGTEKKAKNIVTTFGCSL